MNPNSFHIKTEATILIGGSKFIMYKNSKHTRNITTLRNAFDRVDRIKPLTFAEKYQY